MSMNILGSLRSNAATSDEPYCDIARKETAQATIYELSHYFEI